MDQWSGIFNAKNILLESVFYCLAKALWTIQTMNCQWGDVPSCAAKGAVRTWWPSDTLQVHYWCTPLLDKLSAEDFSLLDLCTFQVIYGSDVTVPVASSTFLEPGYEPLKGRYKVTVTEDDPEQDNFTFRLTIEGESSSSH